MEAEVTGTSAKNVDRNAKVHNNTVVLVEP